MAQEIKVKVEAKWFLVNFNKISFAVLAFKIGSIFDSNIYKFKRGGLEAFKKIARPQVVYVGDFGKER